MQLNEIMKQMETGIKEVYEGDRYQYYLRTMSHFTNYSSGNTALIHKQMPDATLVAGYMTWQKKFNRHVKRGEKAIKILAPIKHKEEDNDKGYVTCRTISVFDVTQTEGDELPTYMDDQIEGTVEEYQSFIDALKIVSPCEVVFKKMPKDTHGSFKPSEKKIYISDDLSQLQTVKTLIHEIAHSKLHNDGVIRSQEQQEVEAESTACAVLMHYGIDTRDYSFSYIAGWSSDKELPELRKSMDRIRITANDIITSIDQLRNPKKAEFKRTGFMN